MNNLITNLEDRPLDTVLIVGNGAIEGGNKIVQKVIAEFEQYSKYVNIDEEYKLSSPDLSTYLASVAYLARDSRYNLLRLLAKGEVGPPEFDYIKFHINLFDKFRHLLGKEFVAAKTDKQIGLVDPWPVFRYLNTDEVFGTISINWDETLLTKSFFNKHLISLHGKASEPQSLILPMETTTDDYIVDLFLNAHPLEINSDSYLLIEKAFRQKEVRESHQYAHSIAQRWLLNAKRIILWGVAFNPYDAELIGLIPKDDRDRQIIIINPDSKARDVTGTLLCSTAKQRIDCDPLRKEEIKKVRG